MLLIGYKEKHVNMKLNTYIKTTNKYAVYMYECVRAYVNVRTSVK